MNGNKQDKTAGEKHRELVARRSRDISKSAREIAPLPPIKNPKRRIAARKDFKYFCEQYFPKKFKLKWSSYHLEVIKRIEDILKQGGGKLALAMPRGSGKTTLIETAVIWAVLFGHARFIVVVGSNKTEAKKIITNIKNSIIENKAILEDFPEAIYPFRKLNGSALLARGQLYLGELTGIEWKPDSITFAKIPGSLSSGATVISVGILGAIRGKNKSVDGEQIRPDTVILDDPQTDADAKNPDRVAKLEGIINSTIEGLVGPGETLSMFMACTIIRDGDLASRYLDHTKYAQWKGLIFKMIERMPERMDLWEKYRDIRKNEDEVAATIFYKKNREAMQKGAVVAWEANYTSNELDSLQFAMNKWCDNYEGFMSEYQNEPVKPGAGTIIIDAETICSRLNGLPPMTIPLEATTLTGFIDVHHDLLYFAVVAWANDYTGYVIDYGTYPEQSRRMFRKSDNDLIVMKKGNESIQMEAVIQKGLVTLLKDMIHADYIVENDEKGYEKVHFSKILVDSGYVPNVVDTAIRLVNSPIMYPSKGAGIKATNKPMEEWQRVRGRLFGTHWLEDRPRGRAFLTTTIDTNYWKSRLHNSFAVGAGARSGLTFWGHEPETHRMIAEHCNSEVAKFVEYGKNKLYEWELIPNRDNHLFDCLVGNIAAASVCGIKLPSEVPEKVPVIK
ncbi:MAG: phage terminase large subunit family protein [Planctomycetaceae bacterium]|jgi:hypothetical protein|nr:phage terminase large subunit family protein [Planctomycetaceae bacterium]